MSDPPVKATRTELGDAVPLLPFLDPDVRMPDTGGRKKNGRARRETNNELEIFENQMATQVGIVIPQGGD